MRRPLQLLVLVAALGPQAEAYGPRSAPAGAASPREVATQAGSARMDLGGVAAPRAGFGQGGVPRRATPEAQLELALEAKRALRGTRGERRQAAREAAAEAYRAVRLYFPRARAQGAEASFRAGELLRSGGDRAGSLEEFEMAWELGARTRFGARAGLELGHTLRRLGRRMDALGWYEAVEALGETWAEERDLGAYGQGRVLNELRRPEQARRCFERAARRGVAPLQRVRAFDAWAGNLIDAGDLEGAAGVLDLARVSLHDAAEELSTLGLRVRAALEGMRSPGRLAREVARRLEERRERQPPSRRAVVPGPWGPPCP